MEVAWLKKDQQVMMTRWFVVVVSGRTVRALLSNEVELEICARTSFRAGLSNLEIFRKLC